MGKDENAGKWLTKRREKSYKHEVQTDMRKRNG